MNTDIDLSPSVNGRTHVPVYDGAAPPADDPPATGDTPPPDDDIERAFLTAVADADAQLLPDELLELMRPKNAGCGVSGTAADLGPPREVAVEIHEAIWTRVDLTGERAAIARSLADLRPAAVAAHIRPRLKLTTLAPLPDNPTPAAVVARVNALRVLHTGTDGQTADISRPAAARIQEVFATLLGQLSAAVRKSPDDTDGLVKAVKDELKEHAADGEAEPAVDALATTSTRYLAFDGFAHQLAERAVKKLKVRLFDVLKREREAAVQAVVQEVAAKELTRRNPAAFGHLDEQAAWGRRAMDCRPKVADLLRGGAAATGGGRTVFLPSQPTDAVRQRVLAAHNAPDVAAVAVLYRAALGEDAPATHADTVRYADRLLALVRADAGAESDFAVIGTTEAARRVAGELFERAHPHVTVRDCDPRLRCDTYELGTVEVPVCPPGLEAVKDALLDELNRLSGALAGNRKKLDVITRPPGVSGIKVYREFGGFYTVNVRSFDYLRAAYEMIQTMMPHDPHPVWSTLVPPRGFLILTRPAGESGK